MSDHDRQGHLDELRRDGPRRFARWDAALFEALVAGAAQDLAGRLGGDADADTVLGAYLGLLHQGVGLAVVRRAAPGPEGWGSYLERCLVEQIPVLLARVPAGRRVAVLAKVWNLGEGLLREPAWLDRYVSASAAALANLEELESFLVRTLEPVRSAAPPASWKGPFAVTVLDLRPLHDDFLPGEIRLAAPTVLRVTDRRRAGLEIGVLLGKGGRSRPLGLMAGLGDFTDSGGGPAVAFQDGRAMVAGEVVAVPRLRRCHRHFVARSGFVAACAVDSQRLWIVECN
ncbi:MAG TPA: hypothetical protein VFW33_04670 [Gemmataceae bacterium]|nr:hypothetical protein [Gemmataceae bacterium]